MVFLQYAVEQGGFAGAQETGEYGGWYQCHEECLCCVSVVPPCNSANPDDYAGILQMLANSGYRLDMDQAVGLLI